MNNNIFNLPDLGEGLPDAEIVQWYIKEGDHVEADQTIVSMETAKAVVDVPSPQSGKIAKLYGQPGDVIETGSPLVQFSKNNHQPHQPQTQQDEGSVVDELETRKQTAEESFIIGTSGQKVTSGKIKASPAVRSMAKKLNIDLSELSASGPQGTITIEDVKAYSQASANNKTPLKEDYQSVRGPRRMMAISMEKAHQQIVPVTICDDAILHHWNESLDITVRIIQAISAACHKEPALNAWFDAGSMSLRLHQHVHLGLATDTKDGLFVPIIQQAESKTPAELRTLINELKVRINQREIKPEEMQGATFTLSNFGTIAGRYASPIIIPPTVAILGIGQIHDQAIVVENKIEIGKVLPLSLTIDHRAVTGGEASRFLKVLIEQLGA